MAQSQRIQDRYGWSAERVSRLFERYGSDLNSVLNVVDQDAGLGRPLQQAPEYLRAEVAFACSHEGALHLEDILTTRVRLNSERRDRGAAVVDEVIGIARDILGWDETRSAQEKDAYLARTAAERAAETQSNDTAAAASRAQASDMLPMR